MKFLLKGLSWCVLYYLCASRTDMIVLGISMVLLAIYMTAQANVQRSD